MPKEKKTDIKNEEKKDTVSDQKKISETKQETTVEAKQEQKQGKGKKTEVQNENGPGKKPEDSVDTKEEIKKEAGEKKEAVSEVDKSTEADFKKSKSVPSDLLHYPELRKDIPELRPGDIVSVAYRVVEGGKERIQMFEGTVIALKRSGIAKTVTIRKTSYGISIERIFPLNSKLVQKIEVKKHSRVRRAKLYYLRKLKGKAARLKELR